MLLNVAELNHELIFYIHFYNYYYKGGHERDMKIYQKHLMSMLHQSIIIVIRGEIGDMKGHEI